MTADDHLSGISTMWTLLKEAHGGIPAAAEAAKELLLARYGEAVRRYLLCLLRDPHAADDLTQEFAIRILSGSFHGADPAKGRFRNYVKTTLFHLVSTHLKKQRAGPISNNELIQAEPEATLADSEKSFDTEWRSELLIRTWAALAEANANYYMVLRARAAHPHIASDELAPALSTQLGKDLTAANLRQTLKRARQMFAELLQDEVARSIKQPTRNTIDRELADLNLLHYVRGTQ